MQTDWLAYTYAFSSVMTFSAAAIGFTYFSLKVSPLWMNIFKCTVSFMICLPIIYWIHGQVLWPLEVAWPFLVSGFIGLNIGDWLLLSGYKRIGPARSLLLFGFQPFIAGTFAYLVWSETIYSVQLIAVLFFFICLFLFSYEKFKKQGRWEFSGLLFALSGVILDSVGVILTRYGFNQNPGLTGIEAQYLRTVSALFSFVIYWPFVKVGLWENFLRLTRQEKGIAFVSSFFGTFLSLVFYMQAVKIGKLATVTSIVLTDPMMSTLFESLWLRVWPSRYLWIALLSFACAMFFLFYPQIFGWQEASAVH